MRILPQFFRISSFNFIRGLLKNIQEDTFVSQLQLKRRVVFLLKFTYILGYAWFPQKDGYRYPPDTNSVNRGGSDEHLFVKVVSQ